jgi:hypothetical protein
MGNVDPARDDKEPVTVQSEQQVEAERIVANDDAQSLSQTALDTKTKSPGKSIVVSQELLSRFEFDYCREALTNANNTLRFQISWSVPLLAACITVLNIVQPQSHQEFVHQIGRFVFILVVISVSIAYFGLQRYAPFPHGRDFSLDMDVLGGLIRFKNNMIRLAQFFQISGVVLLCLFVLLEY